MRERFSRRAALGVVAGLAAAFAVAGFGSVAAAVSPAGEAASAKQYPEKVTICHRTHSKKKPFVTITVSRNALKAHLAHGDAVGACNGAVFTMCQKTKGGKHQTVKVKGARKAARHLKRGDKLGKCKGKSAQPSEKNKGKGKKKGKKK
jgi:hypothetical protein